MFVNVLKDALQLASIDSVRNRNLRMCKLFQNKFETERNLVLVRDFKLRKITAKFRCRDNNLLIEKGRHKKSLNKNALNATWKKLRTKDIFYVSVLSTLIKEKYFSKSQNPPSLDHDYLLTDLLFQ